MKQTGPKIWGVLMQGDLNMVDTFHNKVDALKRAKALRKEYVRAVKHGSTIWDCVLTPREITVVEFRIHHTRGRK